uniref:Tetratricopeptide repeat protein 25-like n=1 Tax=Diabrotica virgifera virgifera TaxID=50390 RepID=A0A6P7F533_DIAVI
MIMRKRIPLDAVYTLIFFNKAVSQTPTNIRSLLGRSKARAAACYYIGALADTYRAFSIAPDNPTVSAQRALNLYLMSEFETALIHNLRHLTERIKPEVFSDGVRHCSIAIENSVGESAGTPLRDYFKLIRKIAWVKNILSSHPDNFIPRGKKDKKLDIGKIILKNHAEKDKKKVKRLSVKDSQPAKREIYDTLHDVTETSSNIVIPPFTEEYPFSPVQHYTTNIENFMSEKYLDVMYREKNFLRDIKYKHGIECPNAKGTQKIKALAKKAYQVVSGKQELLRSRRPFYHLRYQVDKCTTNVEKRLKQEQYLIQLNYRKEAEALLKKMVIAQDKHDLYTTLTACEQLDHFCQNKSKKYLPDKQYFMSEIFKVVRKAFYQLLRLNPIQFKWDQEKRIMLSFGLPVSRCPSNDSVINNYQPAFVDFRKRIEIFENKIEQAESTEEICWCAHELGRFYLHTKKYEMARSYAFNCQRQATKDPELFEWNVNACVLLAKIDIAQKIKPDARNDINKAIDVATQYNDNKVVEYLRLCLDVIDKIEFDLHGPRVLERRKNNILKIMQSDKMKEEFKHLFSQIKMQRPGRRMTLVPGMDGYEEKKPQKHTSGTTGSESSPPPPRRASLSVRSRPPSVPALKLKKTISVSEYLEMNPL